MINTRQSKADNAGPEVIFYPQEITHYTASWAFSVGPQDELLKIHNITAKVNRKKKMSFKLHFRETRWTIKKIITTQSQLERSPSSGQKTKREKKNPTKFRVIVRPHRRMVRVVDEIRIKVSQKRRYTLDAEDMH